MSGRQKNCQPEMGGGFVARRRKPVNMDLTGISGFQPPAWIPADRRRYRGLLKCQLVGLGQFLDAADAEDRQESPGRRICHVLAVLGIAFE